MSRDHRRFRFRLDELPLFWSLLLPFLTLLLVIGLGGTVLLSRNLSEQAQSALNAELQRQSLQLRGRLAQAELSLLESANLAANLEGMAEAVSTDHERVAALVDNVRAVKPQLSAIVVVDVDGVPVVSNPPAAGHVMQGVDLVARALHAAPDQRQIDILAVDGVPTLVLAAPVCANVVPCVPAGVAVVGLALPEPLRPDPGIEAELGSVWAIHDSEGRVLAAGPGNAPATLEPSLLTLEGGEQVRLDLIPSGSSTQTLVSRLRLQDDTTLLATVTVATEPFLATARSAASQVTAVLGLALLAIVVMGALVSRRVVASVRPVIETNAALGRGDLSARAPVTGSAEVAQLADGLNRMAEQLQASYTTLESRVAQRTEEVQRLMKERTEFFASLSHELRTPLAIIVAEGDLLSDSVDPSAVEAGAVISSSAEGLLSTVNEILDLARADAGRLSVDRAPVDLEDLLASFAPTMTALARSADLSVSVDVASDLPHVRGDAGRLHQVVLNLVDNAVKFTPPGGTITLTAVASEDTVRLAIADTGPGIPAEVGDLVFQPFYRVAGTSPRAGRASSGIGLSLSHRLVEAMGGQLTYASAAKVGTTFTVELPRAAKPSRRSARWAPPAQEMAR